MPQQLMQKMIKKIVALDAKLNAAPELKANRSCKNVPNNWIGASDKYLSASSLPI